jgi:sugar phosphate isomerase/epimerase
MKLGLDGLLPNLSESRPVFLPADWRGIDVDACRYVHEQGFRGVTLRINKPLEATQTDVMRVHQAFKDADLEIAQLNGWYESLCDYDDKVRAMGVSGMIALTRIGAAVRAPSVYVRPGGHNPNGHWYAHPENHTQRTFDLIVNSLRQVCAVAQQEGVLIAIEGHVLSALDTPQRMRDLFDAVASPALKFNYDPVNFVGTVKQVHNTSSVLHDMFNVLGGVTVVAHAKDCTLADDLVVHIEEVVPGTGSLNFELFMRQFEQLAPDGYFIIEHLQAKDVPTARDNVVAMARRFGISLTQ